MRCTFCSRQAEHEFRKEDLHFCDSCGRAFREGFEKGRIYESIRRRMPRKVKA
jgi:rRNA maturation endonuclease Nob1